MHHPGGRGPTADLLPETHSAVQLGTRYWACPGFLPLLSYTTPQGFPDAFHLGTLDVLLGALPELQPEVKVHTVMASLMDRLAK